MAEPDKSVFDKTAKKQAAQLTPVNAKPVQETHAAPYHSCPAGEPNQFIHEYVTGRKILIEIDPATGKEHFLKNL